jgi:hypothetical protein
VQRDLNIFAEVYVYNKENKNLSYIKLQGSALCCQNLNGSDDGIVKVGGIQRIMTLMLRFMKSSLWVSNLRGAYRMMP